MQAWYEAKIEESFKQWCSLIKTNPKQALEKMRDINNYRTMLTQRSPS